MAIEPFIKCSDMKLSIQFYTEILDFSLKESPNPDPASFESRHALLERNGSLVHLSSHKGVGAYGNWLAVLVDNCDDLFSKIVSIGLETSLERETTAGLSGGPMNQTWGVREFWVRDPDGNVTSFGHKI